MNQMKSCPVCRRWWEYVTYSWRCPFDTFSIQSISQIRTKWNSSTPAPLFEVQSNQKQTTVACRHSIFSLFQLNCIFRIKQHSSRFDLILVIFAASHQQSLLSIIIIWSRRFAFVCWWPWWVGRWRLFRPWSILHRHAAQRHLCCSYIPNRQRNLRHVPMNAIVSNHPKSHPIVAVRTVVRPLRSWPNRHHHQFVTNAAVTRPKLVPWLGVDAWFLEARPTDVVRVNGGVNRYVKQPRKFHFMHHLSIGFLPVVIINQRDLQMNTSILLIMKIVGANTF